VIGLLQHLLNGLSQGAIYALIALGYTMVYGILRLINFAHGDVFMLGAMIGFKFAKATGQLESHSTGGAVVVALVAMTATGLAGLLIERIAYRPLRGQPRINSLITAIGVSLFLEYGGQVVFGPTPERFDFLPGLDAQGQRPALHFLGLSIGQIDLTILTVSVLLMLGLQHLVFRTRIGTAMRAVSWNPQVAALMGINTDFVISFTFVLGSVLAGAGGLLYASKYSTVQPLMGMMPGLKAFVAAVLGGIGNVPGAMLGGLVLGLVEQLVAGYWSSTWRDAVAFALLIGVLLVKPSGLLGRSSVEKV
jgi:branched-chain amino acid transport system permease protein